MQSKRKRRQAAALQSDGAQLLTRTRSMSPRFGAQTLLYANVSEFVRHLKFGIRHCDDRASRRSHVESGFDTMTNEIAAAHRCVRDWNFRGGAYNDDSTIIGNHVKTESPPEETW